MTFAELKKEVYRNFKPGLAIAHINGKIKQMTNGGDLRKKATWQQALDLLNANKIEPIKVKKAIASKPSKKASKAIPVEFESKAIPVEFETFQRPLDAFRYVGKDANGYNVYLGNLAA